MEYIKKLMNWKININEFFYKTIDVLLIFNILDSIFTYIGIKYFSATEKNQGLIFFLDLFGLEITIILKIVVVSLLLYLIKKKAKKKFSEAKRWQRLFLLGIYIFVVLVYLTAIIGNLIYIFYYS